MLQSFCFVIAFLPLEDTHTWIVHFRIFPAAYGQKPQKYSSEESYKVCSGLALREIVCATSWVLE